MHAKISDSQLVILPRSEPMTLVDQQEMFNDTVERICAWEEAHDNDRYEKSGLLRHDGWRTEVRCCREATSTAPA
jgi:hypothetical protein